MRRWVGAGLSLGGLFAIGLVGSWLVTGGADALWATGGALVSGQRPGSSTRADRPLDALRPTPEFGEPPPPASPGAARVMARIEALERGTRRTRYRHRTRIDEPHGVYEWDCSGMAGWVLAREAPRARRALRRPRPIARTFARTIRAAPTRRFRRGWQRIDHIGDVRPGDVFAWERPPGFRSRNSGHVGFVVNAPARLSADLWAVRIVDSTSLAHQDDSRGPDGGTGRGTLTVLTDGAGHATAYGWHGTRSLGYVTTPVYFGRVQR